MQSGMQTPSRAFFLQRFAFLALILAIGLSAATVSQASPTSPFYPVRVLADKVVSQIAKKPEIKLERRAQDVVISTKEPAKLDQASRAYDKTLDEVKDEAKNKGLQKGLEKAEEKLDRAIEKNPESKDKIEPILKKTRQIKQKLKEKD